MRETKINPRNCGLLKEMIEEYVKAKGCIICLYPYQRDRIMRLAKQLGLDIPSTIVIKGDQIK